MSAQGWSKLGWRKIGAVSDSGGGAAFRPYDRFWIPSRWYPAVDYGGFSSSASDYNWPNAVANVVNDAFYATFVTFPRSGTITNIAQQLDTINSRVWMGVYDTDPATPWQPRNRLYDIEKVAAANYGPCIASATDALTITVTAGRTYWFAEMFQNASAAIGVLSNGVIRGSLGVNFAGGVGGTIPQFFALRHPYSYARVPATFPTVDPATSSSWIFTAAGVTRHPAMLYKFNPTTSENPA
jgi:hypothetical protein